jgi:hypothetical protein
VDNIKMDFGEIGWDGRDWGKAYVDMVMTGRPQKLEDRPKTTTRIYFNILTYGTAFY